jgi:glycosyltransferase involved in cell wall biosynthesis
VPPRSVGAQWVLVRLHGAPLGFVVPPETGCSPQELRAIAVRQLGWRIASHIAADSIGGGDVSTSALNGLAERCPRHASRPDTLVTVAVCTRDRAMQLVECLDALMSLDYPHERLDLLVVDNAPVDASTRELVARYPRVRYVCETRPGLDRARNRAVHEARGDVIAFTDDDGSVDAGWVGAIATAFAEEPHAMCVTGLVVPDELDTPAQALFEAYGGFGRGFDRSVHRVAPGERAARKYGGTGRFGTGANMAFRRSFFDREGLFDPALDVGTPSNGGGDLEMFFRVLKTGHALVYEPAAIVRHRHRRDYAALRAQLANNGTGFYAYVTRTVREYPEERIAMIVLGVWWFSWWNVGRVLRSLVRPRTFPLDLTVAELRGSLAGLRGYFASRRQALRAGEVP